MLKKFSIAKVSKNLNNINFNITLKHNKPFPNFNLLSNYHFKKRFVKITPGCGIQGGLVKMIISLIDFSFVRSLVSHCYATMAPPCYDPPSLFLLDLFRYIDRYQNMSDFVKVLYDKDKGRAYRTYAGINIENIPCEATFSNFRARIGESLYNEIFHVLVDIFHKLNMITFNILSTDGTLYHTRARYYGCCHFCEDCNAIKIENVIPLVKQRILYRLNKLPNINLEKESRVYTDCPSNDLPVDIKTPRIELFAFKLAFCDGNPTLEQKNTAALFGVSEELKKQNLCIITIRNNVTNINNNDGSMIVACHKLPKDLDAMIGVRRDNQNSDKKVKIFGYNAIFSTSVELHLGIELPVAISNIPGNAEEADMLVKNTDQIYDHHNCNIKIALADSKYDAIKNYNYLRSQGIIPIVDYNRRNEKLSYNNLLERGYNQNGWPFAPCNFLCRPNGFDRVRERSTFCCFKQCLELKAKPMKKLNSEYDMQKCPYINNQTGIGKHMFVKDHPRLINEIPRGSKRFKEIKKLRSASERINSGVKEDLIVLHKPKIFNRSRANILAQMAGIVLLLKRALSFIVRVTILMHKLEQDNSSALDKKLKYRPIPASIQNIVKLE